MKNRRAAIYIRPCLACRLDAAEQENAARQAADAVGLTIIGVWREPTRSPRRRRDGLAIRTAMLARMQTGFDTILIADVAALGRNLAELVAVLAEAESHGVEVLVALHASAHPVPVSAMLVQAARRSYAREAAAEGRAKALQRGVRFGRPSVEPERVEKLRVAMAAGMGLRASARAAGVGVATASRIRAAGAD